jgi:hypothetical protein
MLDEPLLPCHGFLGVLNSGQVSSGWYRQHGISAAFIFSARKEAMLWLRASIEAESSREQADPVRRKMEASDLLHSTEQASLKVPPNRRRQRELV